MRCTIWSLFYYVFSPYQQSPWRILKSLLTSNTWIGWDLHSTWGSSLNSITNGLHGFKPTRGTCNLVLLRDSTDSISIVSALKRLPIPPLSNVHLMSARTVQFEVDGKTTENHPNSLYDRRSICLYHYPLFFSGILYSVGFFMIAMQIQRLESCHMLTSLRISQIQSGE